jgi:excisionase family DNA binding protein
VADGPYRDDTYTPAQAAHILRLTPTRVRQLLQSGELEGERDGAGHWFIPARAVHTRLERLRRESLLEAVGYDPSSIREARELVEALRAQVETLYAQLDEAHAANRENRRIIAALTQRIPEPETPPEQAPPQESSGGSEEVAGEPEGVEAAPDTEGVQGGTGRVSWRRVVGL